MSNFKDLTGQTFGQWLIVKRVPKPGDTTIKKKGAYFECICSCGQIRIKYSRDLIRDASKSCGHGRAEHTAEKTRKYDPMEASARRIFNTIYSGNGLTFEEFLELSQQNCYYCGIEPYRITNIFTSNTSNSVQYSRDNGDFKYNGLDRKNPLIGHTKENVVPCCKKCNTAKLDYTEEEFKDWAIKAYTHFILNGKSE